MSESPDREPRRVDVGASRQQVERLARRHYRRLPDEAARSRRIAVAGYAHARDLDAHRGDSLAHLHALVDVALAAVEHEQTGAPSLLGAARQVSFDVIILGTHRDVEVELVDVLVVRRN